MRNDQDVDDILDRLESAVEDLTSDTSILMLRQLGHLAQRPGGTREAVGFLHRTASNCSDLYDALIESYDALIETGDTGRLEDALRILNGLTLDVEAIDYGTAIDQAAAEA